MSIIAKLRQEQGKRSSRRLRKQSRLPASIVFKSGSSLAIMIRHDEIFYSQEKEGFLKLPLEIHIEETAQVYRVIFQEIQRHPFKNKLLHVDFLEVTE